MIYCVVKAIYKLNSEKGRQFPDEFVSFVLFLISNKADLVLVKFFYNAAVRRFLKTFRKFVGKRL